MRETPVLYTASLVLLTVNTQSILPISINSSTYPATPPQAQVSPDIQTMSIDSHSGFERLTYSCINTISQTVPIVNACDSPTTNRHLKIFDKAFNTQTPPSPKVSYAVGCLTFKPKATRLDISFNSTDKTSIHLYCSTLNDGSCSVVTNTASTTTQWKATVAVANQYHKGQGHNPLQMNSTLQTSLKNSNYRIESEITLGNGEPPFGTLCFDAAMDFNAVSTRPTPSIQTLTPVPIDIVQS